MSALKRDDLHVLMGREYIAGLQLGYKLGLEKDFGPYYSILLSCLKDIEGFEQPPLDSKGKFATGHLLDRPANQSPEHDPLGIFDP